MKKNKNITKIFCGFFALMIGLTMISRGADSITVPKVTVTSLQASTLSYYVSGSGVVEESKHKYIELKSDVRVEKILKRNGEKVKIGDKILKYKVEDLREILRKKERSIRKLEIQMEQKKLENKNSSLQKENKLSRLAYENAKSEYEEAKKKLDELSVSQEKQKNLSMSSFYKEKKKELDEIVKQIEDKKKEIEEEEEQNGFTESKLEIVLKRVENKMAKVKEEMEAITKDTYDKTEIIKEVDGILEQAEKDYEDELARLDEPPYRTSYQYKRFQKAEKRYEELKKSYEDDIKKKIQKVYENDKETYEQYQEEYEDAKIDYDSTVASNGAKIQRLETELDRLCTQEDEIELILEKVKAGKFLMSDLIEQQKKEKEDAKSLVKERKYGLETAKVNLENDIQNAFAQETESGEDRAAKEIMLKLELESLSLDMDEERQGETELRELIAKDGYVESEFAGTLIKVEGEEQKPVVENSNIIIGTNQYQLRIDLSDDDAKYLKVGKNITISNSTRSIRKDAKILYIEDEKGENGEIITQAIVKLPKGFSKKKDIKIGDRLEFTYDEVSELYDKCVPVSAIRGTENDTFIYVAAEKETFLGREYVAQKRPVKYTKKDDNMVVLENTGGIEAQEKIINTSNKIIYEGDRVRF